MNAEAVSAYVALGSNLGDRAAFLRAALSALEAADGVELATVSALYETDPVGGPTQGAYLNAVAKLATRLPARALLEKLLEIETRAGRIRAGERNAPRCLDLDLLLYGDARIDEPGLVVPHPRLHERAFVLEPLVGIAPGLLHPTLGVSVARLAERVRDGDAVRPMTGRRYVPWPPAQASRRERGD